MTDVTNALEAVGALIGERSKYEGWIAALESKSDVPSHVLEKVRADYTGRLRTVLQAFSAHAPALESALAEHQARDASLAAQEKSCRDEHAEGELRHMVGEYDSAQWDQVRIGHEAQLTSLASDRESIAVELTHVQRSLAGTAEAAQRLRALGGDAMTSEGVARDESPTPAILAAMAEPVAIAPPMVSDAEFAQSVGSPNTYRPTPPSPPQELMDRRTQLDDLGFLRGSPRTAPHDNGAEYQSTPTAVAARPIESPVLRIVPDEPAASTLAGGIAVDAAKTLRCAECGTMNLATEWYCERCGGELAVI